jgi:glutathione S-transferase
MYSGKVEIAVREKGVPFDLVLVPFDLRRRYEPKHPEVLRVNPKGQVPLLIDGTVEIFDSTQIFEYLEDRWSEPPLWPRSVTERVQARQLELTSDEVFFPHVIRLMPLRGDHKHPDWAPAKAAIEKHYEEIDEMLARSEYLVGGYSYADIAFYMAQVFAEIMGVPLSAAHAHAIAWRDRMLARGPVRQVTAALASYLAAQRLPPPRFVRSLGETGRTLQAAGKASAP